MVDNIQIGQVEIPAVDLIAYVNSSSADPRLKEKNMAFKSVLSGIGHFIEKAFSPQAIQIEASIADLALPGLSSLINETAAAVINVENASIVASKQTGTGAQKSALVIQQIEAGYEAFAKTNGIPVVPTNVQNYVNAVVAVLNSFPMPVTTSSTVNPAA